MVSCQRKPPAERTAPTIAFDKAYNLLTVNQDSAFYYFNKLVSDSRDSQEVALAYTNMAMIQSDAGDYFGAQESLISSIRFLGESRPERRPYQAQNYNELAITSIKLKDYKEAIRYSGQALALTSDSAFRTTLLNNQANAFRYQKKYRPALKRYRQAILLTNRQGKTFARVLTNYAITKWLENSAYNPVPELKQALLVRLQADDTWGQNSSYAHLADYYTGKIADSALFYAHRRHELARRLKSPDDELESLQKLIALAQASEARPYFNRFTTLNDSLQTARNAAKNQFALIRYEAEKNKADNLRLQNENAHRKYQLIVRNILLGLAVAGFVTSVLVFFSWLRKRKIREADEKRQAIEATNRKASKMVHDGLSNNIYLLMKKIKHDSDLDRAWLLAYTENMYNQSRNLSYEMLTEIGENFHQIIGDLLKAFGSNGVKVVLIGNEKEMWDQISAAAKLELRYVLQELMVNMQKHSKAANVILRFDTDNRTGKISYVDDGIGLPAEVAHGNGLINTGNRINSLGGCITFENIDAKGLKIDISFPLA